ncbi:MAG: hypothetical protein WC548_00220 [Candidatus Pacearchaeota archaeon]
MSLAIYSLRPDGSVFETQQLYIKEAINEANKLLYGNEHLQVSKRDISELNLVPQKNPQRWERVMSSIVALITGKIPLRDEVKVARHLFECLDKRTRSNLGLEEIFGLFPYLISGFKINYNGISRNDTNPFSYLVSFTERCLSGDPVNISTYLCAHKQSREKGRDTLRPEIDPVYSIRAINLLKGIIRNSASHQGNINIHQFSGEPRGMNSVFPQVFLKYYSEGRLVDLRDTMNTHFKDLERIAEDSSEKGLTVYPRDAVITYQRAEELCLSEFGVSWRDLDVENISGDFRDIAQDCQKVMMRLMKFGKLDGRKSFSEKDLKDAKELFIKNQGATLLGKAVLEVMFRYAWGKEVAEKKGIAVGLDVDHDFYQIRAFSLGYNSVSQRVPPILYARRVGDKDDPSKKGLQGLSIRQFWR